MQLPDVVAWEAKEAEDLLQYHGFKVKKVEISSNDFNKSSCKNPSQINGKVNYNNRIIRQRPIGFQEVEILIASVAEIKLET